MKADLKKTDPYPNLFEYSPDILKKKTKVLDIINTDKTCLIKISVESSTQEIWIRIHFLEKKRIPITVFNKAVIIIAFLQCFLSLWRFL